MKKFLPYLKKYGILGAVGLVALAGIPLSWYFANEALAATRTDQQKKVDGARTDLSTAKVTYKLEPLGTGAAAPSMSDVPNALLISQTKTIREAMADSSKKVFGEAIAFNRGPRSGATETEAAANTLLVPDLFPSPGDKSQVLRREMARQYATVAHERLLAKYRAAGAEDPVKLGEELDLRKAEIERNTMAPGQAPGTRTPEQTTLITEQLLAARIKKYREHAAAIGFYADMESLPGVSAKQADEEPSLRQSWDWQVQYWIREDIFRAVTLANASSTSVADAVVKRITAIQIQLMPAAPIASPQFGVPEATAADPSAVPPANIRYSPSGRLAGPGSGNGMYDLRQVQVTAVVSAKALPKWLDAIAKTNFMTVLDMDVDAVEAFDHLKQGYYYGSDSVVSVTLVIETAWLREWAKKYMPSDVRAELGIAPDAPPVDPNAPGEPVPPDAPTAPVAPPKGG